MKSNIRRTVLSLLLFLLGFSLSACSNDNIEKRIDRYKSAKVGDFIKFGTYEQNNKEADGCERIEWQILEKDGNKLMIISKKIIGYQSYNNDGSGENATWEDCTLRVWLNERFYREAFSLEEQKLIMTTSVKTDVDPYYDADYGNDTKDKVFILSPSEAERYFDSDTERIAKNTKTVEDFLDKCYRKEHSWWLRTSNSIAIVDDDGIISYKNLILRGVRPVLWIDLDADSQSKQLEMDRDTDALKSVANKLVTGDSFELGAYIQNDWSNGFEPIEWIVLDNQGDRILAVSRYALDCQLYDKTKNANWSKCTLRLWLHDKFYNTAFSPSEQKLLVKDNETQGSVFLLTKEDVEQYLTSSDMLTCSATRYARIIAGADVDLRDLDNLDNWDNYDICRWWLESSYGDRVDLIGWDGSLYTIDNYDGSSSFKYVAACGGGIAVRPAIWLRVE